MFLVLRVGCNCLFYTNFGGGVVVKFEMHFGGRVLLVFANDGFPYFLESSDGWLFGQLFWRVVSAVDHVLGWVAFDGRVERFLVVFDMLADVYRSNGSLDLKSV